MNKNSTLHSTQQRRHQKHEADAFVHIILKCVCNLFLRSDNDRKDVRFVLHFNCRHVWEVKCLKMEMKIKSPARPTHRHNLSLMLRKLINHRSPKTLKHQNVTNDPNKKFRFYLITMREIRCQNLRQNSAFYVFSFFVYRGKCDSIFNIYWHSVTAEAQSNVWNEISFAFHAIFRKSIDVFVMTR